MSIFNVARHCDIYKENNTVKLEGVAKINEGIIEAFNGSFFKIENSEYIGDFSYIENEYGDVYQYISEIPEEYAQDIRELIDLGIIELRDYFSNN